MEHGRSCQDAEPEIAQTSKNASKNKASLETCAICLESITDRAIAVPCNHASFDFLCLVSWAQDHPLCPLCKTELSAIEYEWAGPDDFQTLSVSAQLVNTETNNGNSLRDCRRYRRRCPGIPYPPRNRARNARWAQRRSPTEYATIDRRRQIYRSMSFSYHVGANRVSHFREFTPQTFAHSQELQLKARKWIRRELNVFEFLSPSLHSTSNEGPSRRYTGNAEFLIEYIISILRTTDVKDYSGKAESMLADFLGRNHARLFLHELNAWLRSPYAELETWDRHVQYPSTGYADR